MFDIPVGSFTKGEVSPSEILNITQDYHQGLQKAKNCYITRNKTLKRRQAIRSLTQLSSLVPTHGRINLIEFDEQLFVLAEDRVLRINGTSVTKVPLFLNRMYRDEDHCVQDHPETDFIVPCLSAAQSKSGLVGMRGNINLEHMIANEFNLRNIAIDYSNPVVIGKSLVLGSAVGPIVIVKNPPRFTSPSGFDGIYHCRSLFSETPNSIDETFDVLECHGIPSSTSIDDGDDVGHILINGNRLNMEASGSNDIRPTLSILDSAIDALLYLPFGIETSREVPEGDRSGLVQARQGDSADVDVIYNGNVSSSDVDSGSTSDLVEDSGLSPYGFQLGLNGTSDDIEIEEGKDNRENTTTSSVGFNFVFDSSADADDILDVIYGVDDDNFFVVRFLDTNQDGRYTIVLLLFKDGATNGTELARSSSVSYSRNTPIHAVVQFNRQGGTKGADVQSVNVVINGTTELTHIDTSGIFGISDFPSGSSDSDNLITVGIHNDGTQGSILLNNFLYLRSSDSRGASAANYRDSAGHGFFSTGVDRTTGGTVQLVEDTVSKSFDYSLLYKAIEDIFPLKAKNDFSDLGNPQSYIIDDPTEFKLEVPSVRPRIGLVLQNQSGDNLNNSSDITEGILTNGTRVWAYLTADPGIDTIGSSTKPFYIREQEASLEAYHNRPIIVNVLRPILNEANTAIDHIGVAAPAYRLLIIPRPYGKLTDIVPTGLDTRIDKVTSSSGDVYHRAGIGAAVPCDWMILPGGINRPGLDGQFDFQEDVYTVNLRLSGAASTVPQLYIPFVQDAYVAEDLSLFKSSSPVTLSSRLGIVSDERVYMSEIENYGKFEDTDPLTLREFTYVAENTTQAMNQQLVTDIRRDLDLEYASIGPIRITPINKEGIVTMYQGVEARESLIVTSNRGLIEIKVDGRLGTVRFVTQEATDRALTAFQDTILYSVDGRPWHAIYSESIQGFYNDPIGDTSEHLFDAQIVQSKTIDASRGIVARLLRNGRFIVGTQFNTVSVKGFCEWLFPFNIQSFVLHNGVANFVVEKDGVLYLASLQNEEKDNVVEESNVVMDVQTMPFLRSTEGAALGKPFILRNFSLEVRSAVELRYSTNGTRFWRLLGIQAPSLTAPPITDTIYKKGIKASLRKKVSLHFRSERGKDLEILGLVARS